MFGERNDFLAVRSGMFATDWDTHSWVGGKQPKTILSIDRRKNFFNFDFPMEFIRLPFGQWKRVCFGVKFVFRSKLLHLMAVAQSALRFNALPIVLCPISDRFFQMDSAFWRIVLTRNNLCIFKLFKSLLFCISAWVNGISIEAPQFEWQRIESELFSCFRMGAEDWIDFVFNPFSGHWRISRHHFLAFRSPVAHPKDAISTRDCLRSFTGIKKRIKKIT